MARVRLACHPGSVSSGAHGIEVVLSRSDDEDLAVRYVLHGDLERLRIPAWQGVHAGERLWEHTCFEIFIAGPHAPAYHELNFAPSGAWAAYAFERYRERSPPAGEPPAPRISVRRGDGTLEVEALLALVRLSPNDVGAPLAIGLSAVIEDRDGGLSYWALAHPGAKPDFHHRDGFVVKMDPGSSPG